MSKLPLPRPWSRLLPWAGILVVTLAAYVPAMRGGFIWDDDNYVSLNQSLRSLEGLGRIWTDPSATPQYYPLVHTTYWLEYRFWGLEPMGYHVMNVILHAVSAVLLLEILAALGIPGAWFAAMIFALHPVHVESVGWITERKNVLSAVFYLASFACCLRYFEFGADPRERDRAGRRARVVWLGSGMVLYVAALLSKTVTCSLPAAVLLVLWWKRGRVGWPQIGPLLPFFAVGLLLALRTVHLERHHVGATGEEFDWSLAERCLIAGRALWFYAWKLLIPVPLIFFYPKWEIDPGLWWQWTYPVGALAVVALLWAARRRVGRGPLAAVLFFCGTLFPALGFFNVYPMRYSYVADHFQYLASIGLIVLFAAGAARLAQRVRRALRERASDGREAMARYAAGASASAILCLLAALTWQRGHAFRDLETLWLDTLAKNPRCSAAYNNLGGLYFERGQVQRALKLFEKSRQVDPLRAEPNVGYHVVRAELLMRQGKAAEAAEHLRKATDRPEVVHGFTPYALNRYGDFLLSAGRPDDALQAYRRSLACMSRNPHAEIGESLVLGGRLLAQGKPREALQTILTAIERHPEILTAIERHPEILTAIERHPEIEITARALFVAGMILRDSGEFRKAIDCLQRSVSIHPYVAEPRVGLATCLAQVGRRSEAIEQYKKVLELEPGREDVRAQLEELRGL